MVRAVRRTGLVLALPALVGLSTLAHWLAGQRLHGLWIMPDEAIYAARAEALWRHGPWPLLHGAGSGYGLLYPLLAGLPLSVGNFARGYDSLKLLQALVMSLSAVPVFLYGRRLMPPGYALLAAALTVSSPLLLYSGLVMTEVLFYPLSALALLAVARAVETAAKRDQVIALVLIGLAIATRVQAVVFLGVFAGAVGRRRPARAHDATAACVLAGVARARRGRRRSRGRAGRARRLLGNAARQLPDRRLPPPQLLPLRVHHSDGRRPACGRGCRAVRRSGPRQGARSCDASSARRDRLRDWCSCVRRSGSSPRATPRTCSAATSRPCRRSSSCSSRPGSPAALPAPASPARRRPCCCSRSSSSLPGTA